MPNTSGDGKTFLASVQKMDNTTPASGVTFDQVHQQLVNNDSALMAAISQAIRDSIPSGVIGLGAVTPGSTTALNQFSFANDEAYINGWRALLQNNLVQLDAAPAANVSPALPGSARDDLVFLEFYWSQLNYLATRIRVVDGVDFATYPEGLGNPASSTWGVGDNPNILPQGGNSNPVSYIIANGASKWANASERNITTVAALKTALGDSALYVAGNGSTTAQTTLATADGYVYAIPLFRVRRRNNAGFDPDNNPLGTRDWVTTNVVFQSANWSTTYVGQTFQLTCANNYATTGFQAGDYICASSLGFLLKIVSIDSSTQMTVTSLAPASSGWANNGLLPIYPVSLVNSRPDGLYSNIIDASDIVDLRHQVSLTGFNMQALLEKNLDLLLRGQLTASQNVRYGRDYIGLNFSGYSDDTNTLLYCKFDGSMAGTANGVAVPNTKQGAGAETFANGVQGQGADFSSNNYNEQYSINIPASNWTVEGFFKPKFTGSPSTTCTLVKAFNGSNCTFHIYAGSGGFYINMYDSTGANPVWNTAIPFSAIKSGDILYFKATYNGSIVTLQLNEVTTSFSYTNGQPSTSINLGGTNPNYANGVLDKVRVSNIVRSGTLLPANFSYAKGDRILDGPNSDFSQWSDDLGGISGVNGRINPFGLSRVPNQMAGRVNYSGQEVRHYYGNGITPGMQVPSVVTGGAIPTGAFETNNAEFAYVNANETVDGVRTTFTFNQPPQATGLFLLYDNNYNYELQVNGTSTTPSSMTINPSTGLLTATFATPPTSGAVLRSVYFLGSRHAHFIPSTKGFILHDWTDDSFTADGVKTTFQTSKFAVIAMNHARTAPTSTPSTQTVQNGGTTTQGLNCIATVAISQAAGTSTLNLTCPSTANFFVGQKLRIANGDGTWQTTTVTAVNGSGTNYTLSITALTSVVSQNATVQGNAQVTFTTAPAAGTVDIVYESVLTPSLGDYIRVMYQHTPYQGVGQSNQAVNTLAMDTSIRVTTRGTGKVPSYNTLTLPNITPQLPISFPVTDASLKDDYLTPSSISAIQARLGGNNDIDYVKFPIKLWNYNPSGSVESVLGTQWKLYNFGSGASIPARGINGFCLNTSSMPSLVFQSDDLASSVPHLGILGLIVSDAITGEVYLCVITTFYNSKTVVASSNAYDVVAIDFFKLQGRPMIKGYGGVAA